MAEERRPSPFDYNDPVFRHGVEGKHLEYSTFKPEYSDIHPLVADRLMLAGEWPVLDLGCGPGVLGRELDSRGVPWVGIDRSPVRLDMGHGQRILGDGCSLPFRDETFGAVAAIYMLYHFEDPMLPIREAHRVLRPGGVFAAAAPSWADDEEFVPYGATKTRDTFDSEVASEMVGAVFTDIRSDVWDVNVYRLPDRESVWSYLVGMQFDPEVAARTAERIEVPFWVRKRGSIVWGRKAG